MAEVNPNIVLGLKPMEIQNPLDLAGKAIGMSNALAEQKIHALQTVQKQREIDDDTAMRNAYSQNTTVGPGGMPVVDSTGVAKSLVDQGRGALAMSFSLNNQKQKIDMMKQHQEASEQLLYTPIGSQQEYDDMADKAVSLGLHDPRKMLGATFDDKPGSDFQVGLAHLRVANRSAKDQVQMMQKGIDQQIAQHGQELKAKELQQAHEHFVAGHEQEANQAFAKSVEASMNKPDVNQAMKDTYSVEKIKGLVSPYADDLNKAPNMVVNLTFQELGKLAKGGVATEGEFEKMVPAGSRQKASEIWSAVVANKPLPANAGEYLKPALAYVNDIDSKAQAKINQAYNDSLSQHAMYMNPQAVENAKATGAARFRQEQIEKMRDAENAPKGDKISHDDAIAAATKLLNNPKSTDEQKKLAAQVLDVANKKKTAVGKN